MLDMVGNPEAGFLVTQLNCSACLHYSPKGKYVISGSEDHFIYLWKTQHEFYKFSSARRDRNDYYEAVKGN